MADEPLWIGRNGEKYGPYTEADVRRWQAEGKLGADALVWRSGMPDWVPLASLFPPPAGSATPPPPPPAAAPPLNTPPFAAKAATTDRSTLPAPPSLHWGLVLLFTVFSAGIFGMIWPFIQASWVRKIDRDSKATLLLGIAIACWVIGYILYIAGLATLAHGGASMLGLGGMLLLAYAVLYLVAYFSMAGSLRRGLSGYGLPVEIGGVTLFFFTMYYLQAQLSWVARWKDTGQTVPGASKGIFWLLFCLIPVGIAILAILVAIMIPAYQH